MDLLWFKKKKQKKKERKRMKRYVFKYLKNYYIGIEVYLLCFCQKAKWEPIVKIV